MFINQKFSEFFTQTEFNLPFEHEKEKKVHPRKFFLKYLEANKIAMSLLDRITLDIV